MQALADVKIGLGGSFFWPGADLSNSQRVIRTAYDIGISHFDVAPAYCHGWAETVLGSCRLPREKITITTKTGLYPPKNAKVVGWVASFARALTGRKKLRAPPSTSVRSIAHFDVSEMSRVFARSLKAMRVDYVDTLLLHEAQDHLVNDEAVDWLEKTKSKGIIGNWGAGTQLSDLILLDARIPLGVWQYSALEAVTRPNRPHATEVFHGVFAGFAAWVRECLVADSGIDPRDSQTVNRLCIASALEIRPGSTVLFSTRSINNLETVMDVARDASLRRHAQKLIARERTRVLESSGSLNDLLP